MKEEYLSKMNQWLLQRKLEGGTLSREEELKYVKELDDIWWELTNEEQEEIEQHLTNNKIDAPESLDLVDVDVEIGSNTLPRKVVD